MKVRSSPAARRRGAAAVEFAVVMPILVMLIFGIIDFSRAMIIHETVCVAARGAARAGSLPDAQFSDITNAVDDTLTAAGLTGGKAVAVVHQSGKNVAIANNAALQQNKAANSLIEVTVTVPWVDNKWLPGRWLISDSTVFSQTVSMRREIIQ